MGAVDLQCYNPLSSDISRGLTFTVNVNTTPALSIHQPGQSPTINLCYIPIVLQ